MNKLLITIATLFAYSIIFAQTWNTGTGAWISPLSKNIGIQKSLQVGDNLGTDSLWCKTDLNYFEGNVGIGTTTPEAKLHVSISDTLGSDIAHFENNIDNAIITVHTHSDSSALYLLQTEDFNAVYGLVGTTGEVIITTGLAAQAIQIDTNANVTIPDLAGSAQKLVTALADGTLDTTAMIYGFTIDGNDNMYAGTDLDSLTSGVSNLVIGLGAGLNIADAINNTIIDAQVLNLVSGSSNVFVGKQIVATSDNSQSVAIGHSSTVDDLGVAIGYLAIAGEQSVAIGGGGTDASFANSIAIGTVSTTAISQMVCGAVNSVYFGNGVTNPSPFDITIHATGGNGTNATGADMLLAAGISTGNSEAGGQIQFLTSDTTASGTTPQTLSEKIAITKKGDLIINLETKGLVVFDGTNYWRLTNTAGAASFTDLGTSRPD